MKFFSFSPVHVVSVIFARPADDDDDDDRPFADPFIDDNVEFARRLRQLRVKHHVTVVDQWPHGFLDFGLAGADVGQYNQEIIEMLKKIILQRNPVDSLPDHID